MLLACRQGRPVVVGRSGRRVINRRRYASTTALLQLLQHTTTHRVVLGGGIGKKHTHKVVLRIVSRNQHR